MFSFMAVAHPRSQKPARRAEVAKERAHEEKEEEQLRRRNKELERELREGREREEELRIELEKMKQRLSMVEEAEERLCSELGELEAEAVAQAREYHLHVKALADQLAHARGLLFSCEIHSDHGLMLVGGSS